MKKIIASLLVLFVSAVCFAGVTNAFTGLDKNQKPSDIYVVKIGTGYGANDTIAAGTHVRYGPYPLAIDPSRPSFKYLRFYSPIGALVADSLQTAYMLLPSNAIADTGAVTQWVACDTLQPGEFGTTVDISAKAGVSILFRVMNTAGATAIIRKPLKAVLKTVSTEMVDIKH
jgi:hypothetical protein